MITLYKTNTLGIFDNQEADVTDLKTLYPEWENKADKVRVFISANQNFPLKNLIEKFGLKAVVRKQLNNGIVKVGFYVDDCSAGNFVWEGKMGHGEEYKMGHVFSVYIVQSEISNF